MSYIMADEAELPLIDFDSVLVHIDQPETPLGKSDYYVKICKAACRAVHAKKAQENQGRKVFSRFVDYEVMRVTETMYMSDLKEDGYLD